MFDIAGSASSYEGLKRSPLKRLRYDFFCSASSYEGLKHTLKGEVKALSDKFSKFL